jgi:hypothetical protein
MLTQGRGGSRHAEVELWELGFERVSLDFEERVDVRVRGCGQDEL